MKYDGKSQGIPLCSLHADSRHTVQNVDGSPKSERFDWITVLHNTSGKVILVPVQLCCLIEIMHRNVSTFWFIGAACKECPKERGDTEYTPFPKVQYDLSRRGDYEYIFDEVDSVNEPAMVIPVSLKVNDYLFQSDKLRREKIRFTSIPFGFLFRDDWGEGINYGLNNIHNAWKRIPCISASWKNTDRAYVQLKETLSRNAAEGTRMLNDEDAIDDYDEVLER